MALVSGHTPVCSSSTKMCSPSLSRPCCLHPGSGVVINSVLCLMTNNSQDGDLRWWTRWDRRTFPGSCGLLSGIPVQPSKRSPLSILQTLQPVAGGGPAFAINESNDWKPSRSSFVPVENHWLRANLVYTKHLPGKLSPLFSFKNNDIVFSPPTCRVKLF